MLGVKPKRSLRLSPRSSGTAYVRGVFQQHLSIPVLWNGAIRREESIRTGRQSEVGDDRDPGYRVSLDQPGEPGAVAGRGARLDGECPGGDRLAHGGGRRGRPGGYRADLAGLTGLYQALQANEYAVQDGSYDLAKVLGGSSFLMPLSSHDGDSEGGVGFAVWGGGDFRTPPTTA